jgi:PKD repeat protein
MKITTRLLLIAALFALVLPLVFTGIASAKFLSDGAVPDGVTGGWKTPNDMVCIKGLAQDGTLDMVPGVTNARQCIYYNTGLTSMDPVDVTASSICAATTAGPFTAACGLAGGGNCKYTSAKTAATWDSTNSKCYDNRNCLEIGATGNDGAKHSVATSICLNATGAGFPLTGLDRTYSMCVATAGNVWKQTSATAPYPGAPGTYPTPGFGGSCVAYGRQFKGQDAAGTPLAWGTEGTVQAAGTGFCYTNAMKTGIAVGSCPSTSTNSSTAFGYSVLGAFCTYNYGITGDRTSALTKADGTSYGPTVNMANFTTLGDCLANGGSWANWIPGGTAATAPGGTATIMTFDLTRQAVDGDEGCLHCHSTVVEYNGPAERFKDSYLKTGHKNMLRKVTAGMKMAGPDGIMYDTLGYAAGSINFGTTGNNDATATVSSVAKPLLYLFGDWMAAAPAGLDVVVNMSGNAKYNGGSDYSCAACHTAGWGNSDPTKGLCNYSSKTTQVSCEAVLSGAFGIGIWTPISGVQAIGTTGYAGTQPGDSFPGINFGAAGQWDLDGIQCGRCHNATVPSVSATQIAASKAKATYPTGGGMGNVPGGPTGEWATNLCFSCHQSMAKTSNGIGVDADILNPTNLIVKNSITTGTCNVAGKTSESACQTATPTAGIWTPTSYVPMFSGHVLGNSFLNSPHARFTGTVAPNSMGKYDIYGTTAYSSTFKGYMCWQSITSTSPAKTKANGHEITDKTTCEGLYGVGAWRPDARGNCTSCHDVHNSLFVQGQEGLRKECESCHDNATYAAAVGATATQVNPATINHLTSLGTPFDPAVASNSCEVCHMPKPTGADFPMHLWRINCDPAYSTFPSAEEYGAGFTPTKKIANAATDGAYTPAVWVDVDLACGQCHGGSAGAGAVKYDAPYRSKASLADVCNSMHSQAGVNYPVSFTYTIGVPTTLAAALVGTVCDPSDSVCLGKTFTYDWDFGDGTAHGTTLALTHTYATAGSKTVKLTVSLASGGIVGSATRNVTVTTPLPAAPDAIISGGACTWVANTWTLSCTDASTPLASGLQIIVDWGDLTSKTIGAQGATFTHTYTNPGSFNVTLRANDSLLRTDTVTQAAAATPAYFSLGATVKKAGVNLASATVQLYKQNATTLLYVIQTSKLSAADGTVSFGSLKPGSYKLVAVKSGSVFPNLAATSPIAVGPTSATTVINAP